MSEILKPCPFCGGEAFYIKIMGNYEKPHEIFCSKCDGAITEGRSEKQVVTNWNTRPIEDALNKRIAELEGELAELKERFDITDGLLNQATVSIGAVIACCTYNSNAEAMAGAYGISYRAFTMIDNFIKNYNRAVLDGKASTDVKNIICCPPTPPEVQE